MIEWLKKENGSDLKCNVSPAADLAPRCTQQIEHGPSTDPSVLSRIRFLPSAVPSGAVWNRKAPADVSEASVHK